MSLCAPRWITCCLRVFCKLLCHMHSAHQSKRNLRNGSWLLCHLTAQPNACFWVRRSVAVASPIPAVETDGPALNHSRKCCLQLIYVVSACGFLPAGSCQSRCVPLNRNNYICKSPPLSCVTPSGADGVKTRPRGGGITLRRPFNSSGAPLLCSTSSAAFLAEYAGRCILTSLLIPSH